MDEPARAQRFALGSDTAILDGEHFFIRGRLEIPIVGAEQPFAWDVWVTMGRADFDRAIEYWDTPGRERLLEPTGGYLSTTLPGYPDTLNLMSRVHTRPLGLRPYIELEPTDHPLSIEQRTGITWDRVEEIASLVLHQSKGGA
jgi:hypothetical protein